MRPRLLLMAGLVLAGLLVVGTVQAQTSPGYDLSWHVVAGGGREWMSSGIHQVNGTLGQFAIGRASAPDHAVGSGYWYGMRIAYRLFIPLLTRSFGP